jgi:predicted ribosome quality control (RQC) complex YloA/Tae2 family protein
MTGPALATADPTVPEKPTRSRYDELLDKTSRDQDETHQRNLKLIERTEKDTERLEKNIERQEADIARYEKIMETWERQQAEYQKYLDGLAHK